MALLRPSGELMLTKPWSTLLLHSRSRGITTYGLTRIKAVGDQPWLDVCQAVAKDVGLAVQIEALRHAYHGELNSHYTDEDGLLRVAWSR